MEPGPKKQKVKGGGASATFLVSDFTRGFSLEALRTVAADVGRRSTSEAWSGDDSWAGWATRTAPPGWTATKIDDGDGWRWVYQRFSDGATFTKTRSANPALPAACLSSCSTVADLLVPGSFGKPTHFLSYPWDVPFGDVVEAAAEALRGFDGTPFIWMDVLVLNYHHWLDADFFLYDAQQAIASMGRLIQVCTKWDAPERLKRAWMMLESFTAVASNCTLSVAMTSSEQSRMADQLRLEGPNAVLGVVFELEADPEKAVASDSTDLGRLRPLLRKIIEDAGGIEAMQLELAERTRRAYAEATDAEFEQRWQTDVCGQQPAEVGAWDTYKSWQDWEADPSRTVGEAEQRRLDAFDLGHQLACLWALTDNAARAEELFRKVLGQLDVTVAADGSQVFAVFGRVARADRTSAELVKMLNQLGKVAEAPAVEKAASPTKQLAVSWKGLSVSFLEQFVLEHGDELAFLSTDAVVERLVKPRTKSTGVALIETVPEDLRGTPDFFLTHAWRSTFHVSVQHPFSVSVACFRCLPFADERFVLRSQVPDTCSWRGGIMQAVIASVPESERASTHLWFGKKARESPCASVCGSALTVGVRVEFHGSSFRRV